MATEPVRKRPHAPPRHGAAHRAPHPAHDPRGPRRRRARGLLPHEFTDHYVKLLFPRPDVAYPEPFDMEKVRAELPREQWPSTRTYTVRAWDAEAGELTIDFVHHGDSGLAGPWAANARPGDEIFFNGPGGAYAPRADAGWHLLAGDESAIPASPPPSNASRTAHPPASSSRSRAPKRSRASPRRTAPRSSGCTAARTRSATCWSRPSRNSTSRTARCTPSSTARRTSSRPSAATSASTAASPWPSSRSPATGAAAATRTAGSPASETGTTKWNKRKRPPSPKTRGAPRSLRSLRSPRNHALAQGEGAFAARECLTT